jgi:pimeloyl-ACP methyl ester carboxylesterase
MRTDTLTMADGRTVGFADYGPRAATPVIWCHGGPGCRREPEYFARAAAAAGLRLIGIDRPGYGRSTPQPGRTIGGWVRDALAVADKLGVDEFATVGASTGGAYALALAAHTRRVLAAVACCAVTDMRWPPGRALMPSCVSVWDAPSRAAALAQTAETHGARGEKVRDPMLLPLAPSDKQMFADPAWAQLWNESIAEWFAQGLAGYTDDRLADGAGWHSFDVTRITCPVAVLHGTSDTMAPAAQAAHTREIVPGARLELRDGLGHFSILTEVVPTLSALLTDTADTANGSERKRRASAP